jgi:hypothetical protein
VEIKRDIRSYRLGNGKSSEPLVRAVISWVTDAIGREARNTFLTYVFERNITSSKDLAPHEGMGLLMWAKPTKDETAPRESPDGKWHSGNPEFTGDLSMLRRTYGGQLDLIDKIEEKKENPSND